MTATKKDITLMLGTILPGDPLHLPPKIEKNEFTMALEEELPESFDSRVMWSNCAGIIGHVRDQSSCGSCWAFSSTEAFNDRHCIATGDTKTLFSVEDTVSCCTGFKCGGSMGCNGGQPSGAWDWFTRYGVTSGGDFTDRSTGNSCKPYDFESCAHHIAPPEGMVDCHTIPDYKTPVCQSECSDSEYATNYKTDKHFAKSSYSVRGEVNIQKELMEHGTLSVSFNVYEDFELYKSGVYHHVTGAFLGGHAVKLIGWGVDNGVKYWICVNSWNELWGEQGTFRILRGKTGRSECGIEDDVVGGEVEAKPSSYSKA
eukprot:CAMPEP_0119034120 /NCGR_PEP_ID=MMETSP1177-20130426/1158_1 /TAXON_ID=2985 /ORGANISM="Ochromonas sp, Strain CCMP1899" /LENGTH=313 /DNA_ID=CAMNT_0006991361 /DNA_START=197 /DNA_END=1138 /DNA_ORIENTATION=-